MSTSSGWPTERTAAEQQLSARRCICAHTSSLTISMVLYSSPSDVIFSFSDSQYVHCEVV